MDFLLQFLQRPPVAFYIENLEPGSSYRIILFAVNAKGRSEPTIIDDITFKGVAKFTGKFNKHPNSKMDSDIKKSVSFRYCLLVDSFKFERILK